MIKTCNTYRKLIASILAGWMAIIIISGIVFIHKEVTSKGEIVTHIHPYDFTNKSKKHQHKNDAEIQYLNVLYHGTFIDSKITSFEAPILQEFEFVSYAFFSITFASLTPDHKYLRGPPSLV